MERAYSLLTIKAVDQDERVIEGVASTPETDLCGDRVEPLGARFKLPLPLLWQHQHDQPIGAVEWAMPTATGIPFRARLARVTEPGRLRDRLDEAWQSIRAGLVKGVSVGFQAIKVEPISTGIRFVEWSWHELSAVTIPANQDASIATIKAAFAASTDQPSPLWHEVWDAGQRAMNELRSGPGYQKASSASRMAGEARVCGMEMAKALASRIESLELQLVDGRVEYRGVWSAGQTYLRGQLVTSGGNIWHCDKPTTGKPGEDHASWTLAVRKGRDARDAR